MELKTNAPIPERIQQRFEDNRRKAETRRLKAELSELSEDVVQDIVGEFIPNMDDKKARFLELHERIRILEGKEPRTLKTNGGDA